MTLARFGTLALAIGLMVGCTRKVDAPAKVSLSIAPSVQGKSDVSAMSLELTRLMINVTKPGQPTVVVIRDGHESNSSVSSDVEIEVPSGNDQLLQVLAVYEESSNSGMAFYYQDVTLNLAGGTNEVSLTLQQIGTSSGVEGRIVGRYALPGPTYPTAKLEMVYNPGPGRQPMVVSDDEIVGGWFNLFLLDDIRMTYRFKDSKVPISFTTNYVASNRVESTNVKLSDFTAVNYSGGVFPGIGIVDLSAQTSMFRSFQMSGAGDYEPVTPFKIIYGFHGSSDFPWTGVWMKFFDSATTNFSIMKTLSKDGLDPDCSGVNMNSTLSVMDVASTATTTTGLPCTIYSSPVSYMSHQSGGATNASPLASWTTDYLEVDRANLDGNGNDSVAPFRGILRMQTNSPLAYTSTMSMGMCSSGCAHAFNLKLVSGVDSVIDLIKIYKSSTMTADEARGGDHPNCEKLSNDVRMTLIGTIDVTAGTSIYNNNSIPFDASDVGAENPVAICPVDSSGRFLPGAVVFQSNQFFN
jgi:hypothetical protein